MINRLCDRALHHGHLAGAAVIDGPIAALACADADAPVAVPVSEPLSPLSGAATDVWFAETDACVQEAADDLPTNVSDPAPPGWVRSAGRAERPRTVVPLTRMETLQRRWFRRAKIALLLLIAFSAAQFGIAFVERELTEPLISPSVGNPPPPQLPKDFVVPPGGEDDVGVPVRAFAR
jgi:hypothetical protein